MQGEMKSLPLSITLLDQENVRFGGDVAQSQREAIDLMMADPVDAKKIYKLADHIADNGLDPTELQLVMPDDEGNYIVLEGNRRLTALKLLQKPDLCPDEKLARDFVKAHKKIQDKFPSEIICSVVPSRDEGSKWVELKHTGENGGVGRVNWDSNIRDEVRARKTGVETIGRQIRNLVRDNPGVFSSKTISDVMFIPVTTLTRLFSSTPAQNAFQLKVENKLIVPKVELKFIAPSVEFSINLFRNEGYNVNDIRNDEDRRNFLSHIPPEYDPVKLSKNDTNIPDSGEAPYSGHSSSPSHNSAGHTGAGSPDPSNASTGSSGASHDGSPSGDSDPSADPTSDDTIKKPRAKPSSRARKYLLNWPLNITNRRINAIYRELRQILEVDKCPNAVAIAFRVFIEVTCDDYVDQQKKLNRSVDRVDNNKPLNNDDKLSIKVAAVVKDLESTGLIAKPVARAIAKRATSKDNVGSVDHFNQFVHSSASAPLPSELKDIADEYRPMLEAIWS